jgi:CDP-diacylglycerol pyrophosphatase
VRERRQGEGVAILKVPNDSAHYLTIPTAKVTGIEDVAVKKPGFPNYWSYAWESAETYVKKPAEWMGLAINSVAGRSQRQMHIHAACVGSDVKTALEQHRGEIKESWAQKPFLTLRGHEYNAMRIGKGDLASKNPFQLLLNLPVAARHMEKQTLAVIGYKDGFYILDGYTHGSDRGHAEELLDRDCSGAP